MNMTLTYQKATESEIETIYALSKKLIDDYENVNNIDYEKVLGWVRNKIEKFISDYTVIYQNDIKVGYCHFHKNDDAEYEIDDLYVFPEFQNRGIGTQVIKRCCFSVDSSVMLYVFIKNIRAVSLYKRLGFQITENINNSRYIMKRDPQ